MSPDNKKASFSAQPLAEEDLEAVSGGKSKSPSQTQQAWKRLYCPHCGKDRTMNADVFGNYTCIFCHKQPSLPNNK